MYICVKLHSNIQSAVINCKNVWSFWPTEKKLPTANVFGRTPLHFRVNFSNNHGVRKVRPLFMWKDPDAFIINSIFTENAFRTGKLSKKVNGIKEVSPCFSLTWNFFQNFRGGQKWRQIYTKIWRKIHFFILLLTCRWIDASYGHAKHIIRFPGCFCIIKKQ